MGCIVIQLHWKGSSFTDALHLFEELRSGHPGLDVQLVSEELEGSLHKAGVRLPSQLSRLKIIGCCTQLCKM